MRNSDINVQVHLDPVRLVDGSKLLSGLLSYVVDPLRDVVDFILRSQPMLQFLSHGFLNFVLLQHFEHWIWSLEEILQVLGCYVDILHCLDLLLKKPNLFPDGWHSFLHLLVVVLNTNQLLFDPL